MASSHGIYVMQRFRWNASNALFMDREPMCIEEVWASIQQVGTSSLGPGLMGETHRRMCALGTGEGHTPESPHNIPRWVAVHARKDFSMETSPPALMFGQAAKDPPSPFLLKSNHSLKHWGEQLLRRHSVTGLDFDFVCLLIGCFAKCPVY